MAFNPRINVNSDANARPAAKPELKPEVKESAARPSMVDEFGELTPEGYAARDEWALGHSARGPRRPNIREAVENTRNPRNWKRSGFGVPTEAEQFRIEDAYRRAMEVPQGATLGLPRPPVSRDLTDPQERLFYAAANEHPTNMNRPNAMRTLMQQAIERAIANTAIATELDGPTQAELDVLEGVRSLRNPANMTPMRYLDQLDAMMAGYPTNDAYDYALRRPRSPYVQPEFDPYKDFPF